MLNAITCPTCGLEEPFVDGDAPIPLHEVGLFCCNGCKARYVYGKLVPPIVVEPFDGPKGVPFTRIRVQNPQTREDVFVLDVECGQMSAALAKNILAIGVR